MKRSRKLIYCSVTKKEGRAHKARASLGFLIGAAVLFLFADSFPWSDHPITRISMAFTTALLFVVTFLWTYVGILGALGVKIFDDGIRIPSIGLGRFILFSDIVEIKLNGGPEATKKDIEIQTIRGKAERLPKPWIIRWDEFHRVLTEDLKGKIRVVE